MEVDRSVSQWWLPTPRITWSAVFAGWAVALALQMVLSLAGLGFGAWAVDLHDANPTEGIPVGTGVWTAFCMLLSAFVGGYITARLSSSVDRADGLYHGIVVWGLNWLVFACLTTTAMAGMVGGAFSLFGSTLQSVAQGFFHVISAPLSRSISPITLPVDDLRREIESVVHATSKPHLHRDALSAQGARETQRQDAQLSRVTDTSLTELRERLSALDRGAAVSFMVNRYGLTDAQARDVVQSTIGLLVANDNVREVKRSAVLKAQALDRLGMIALWLSGLGLITLVVSAVGGILGTPGEPLIETTTHAETFLGIRRAS